MDNDTSPGSPNAGLAESVAGGVEGDEHPTSLGQTRDGQGVDQAAAESAVASETQRY